jgi:hypothetical protein
VDERRGLVAVKQAKTDDAAIAQAEVVIIE